MKVKHCARFSGSVLDRIYLTLGAEYERLGRKVTTLDPFAGTGEKVAQHLPLQLVSEWTGVEVEPEWADVSDWVRQGDSLDLPAEWTGRFDAWCSSPTYGQRFSDHHDAKDGSARRSYTHDMRAMTGDPARKLHPNNSGTLRFGPAYQELHSRVIMQATRCIKPGGLVVVNMSDHFRTKGGKPELVPVVDWWAGALDLAGLVPVQRAHVETSRLRYGANEHRADGEVLLVYRRPVTPFTGAYEVRAGVLQPGEGGWEHVGLSNLMPNGKIGKRTTVTLSKPSSWFDGAVLGITSTVLPAAEPVRVHVDFSGQAEEAAA